MRSEKVTYYSEGDKIGGVVYLPDGEQGKPRPAIVQGPGFLGLKDAKHYIMMYERLRLPLGHDPAPVLPLAISPTAVIKGKTCITRSAEPLVHHDVVLGVF